jgi:glucose-1-phosphate thymidylyltransferase
MKYDCLESKSVDILVLGGGYGTRLFGEPSLGVYVPKGLISIGGQPAIERCLGSFKDERIDRVIIETNNEGKIPYEEWLKTSGGEENMELFVESISTRDNCLGVLETINLTNKQYGFNKPVLLLAPDNLFTSPQTQIFDYGSSTNATILTYEVESIDQAKKYGVINLDGKTIVGCTEKPENPYSKNIRTACEIWTPKLFDKLEQWLTKGNSDRTGDFIGNLIKQGIQITSCPVNGKWIDIGSEEDLAEAQKIWG